MERKEIDKVIDLTFEWCHSKYGESMEKPLMIIDWNSSEYCGLFVMAPNNQPIILIYPEMCKTISKLVRTVIHEYRHFLQFKTYDNFLDYSTVSEKFSYEKNPYEMDCLSFEDLNFKSCYNVVIRKYKKSIYGFNI